MFDKIKPLLADDTAFHGLIILLVALVSFGLGRLSMAPGTLTLAAEKTGTITLATGTVPAAVGAPLRAAPTAATTTTQGPYVASKNGTKYYLTTCGAANRIKAENRVFFQTVGEATKAGLAPAVNCPGLSN